MSKEDILNTCAELARSQGFYGRLYNLLIEDEEKLEFLESQNFETQLDFILFIESY